MNFREASRKLADLSSAELTGVSSDWPIDRPTHHQPDVKTDGQDPGAPGGPSPLNSGVGPYGEKVVSDPLVPVPYENKGAPMPHIVGPDVDETTLRSWKERG